MSPLMAAEPEPNNMKIKSTTKRAIAKYGIQTCIDAYAMHEDGNGASTVSHSFSILNGNTNAGDAAINAGRDINTVQVQIASAMDDCGTNEIRTIEMTKAEEREYNEGMAKLAEMWG
jgi:hypothetical protein